MCFAPQRRRALFSHLNCPKVVRTWGNFVHFDFKVCFAPQCRALFSRLNFQKSSEAHGVLCHFWLQNVLLATTACTFSTSQLPKVVRTPRVLPLLTSTCASRHNGVHFFHISTSKSRPNPTCFATFYFKMCFSPQRRALFPHLNFQKWSRDRRVLTLFTSKCASRHNGVQFFMSHLASYLRTRRFSEPTFRPSGATKHWQNTVFRDFPTFSAHLHLLSSDFLHLLSFPSLIFSLLTLSTSEFLPCCAISIFPYCRKFSFQTSFEYVRLVKLGLAPNDQFWIILESDLCKELGFEVCPIRKQQMLVCPCPFLESALIPFGKCQKRAQTL